MFIRQLEAFRAIMLAGTTSGAAALLGVSQPAVSRLIGRLERELSLTLFDRSKGRLAPTVEAQILHGQIERTFVSAEKIREVAANIGAAQVGHLHVAALPAIGLGFLPGVIRDFHRDYPNVTLTAEVNISARVEESVAAQRVDLGIAEFPFRRPGIVSEVFCNAPECLVVPEGHPLASAAVVRPADLEGAPFISLMRDLVGRHVIDRVFERAGVTRRLVADTQVNATICELVQRGVGLGIVDPFTAADYAARGVTAVPFRPSIKFRLGVLYPTHRPLSRVARAFLSVLRRRRNALLRGDGGRSR
ncbi:MAG TPA: LysR substrate-binding domain-containing protein [Stellaceae bacterium]|nr:LysR substrate-binding domain-containing protein [Stellaceae bacterium]